MGKLTHALAATAGCAAGFLAMGVVFSQFAWRTCKNVHEGDGFKCSACGSHTDYEPLVEFRFCPMCGAYSIREDSI